MAPQRTLSWVEAQQIRARRPHERGIDLAAEYGVSPQTICDIVHGRRYAEKDRAGLLGENVRLKAELRSMMDRYDELHRVLNDRTDQLHRAWRTIEALEAEVKELLP